MSYQARCLARIAVTGRAPRIRPSGKVYQPTTRECGTRRTLRQRPSLQPLLDMPSG